MKLYFLDTETCGLHGIVVTIQYAIDDGPVCIHEVWRTTILETMSLLEEISDNCVIGFNLAFDWFHLSKLYTILQEYVDNFPDDLYLEPERVAEIEPLARNRGCLKPRNACDVMLHIRKGPYQSTMDRKNIYIKRVPAVLARQLVTYLNEHLPFEPLYFSRRKVKGPVWQIQETKDVKFVNVYVAFAPSIGLKPLIENVFGIKTIPYKAIEPDPKTYPLELGYAPYALAVTQLEEWKGEQKSKFRGKWKGAWPQYIEQHIRHWGFMPTARKYAGDDVEYTRKLYYHFNFAPGDDDSILACMVGAVRWRGFSVNLEGIKELKATAKASKIIKEGKWKGNEVPTAPNSACNYIKEVMDPTEQIVMPDSTDKEALLEIISWETEASKRAQEVFDARRAQKEIEMYDKLLLAGRLHAAFKVLGTLSSRMAGDAKFNVQGVKKTKVVRSKFPLAWEGTILCGGDFKGFEVTIADAVYNDPDLRAELQHLRECHKCHGTLKCEDTNKKSETFGQIIDCEECEQTGQVYTKIHALFGTFIFPNLSYEEIIASDGQSQDYYTTSKSGLFTWLFAGTEYSMYKRLGIPKEQGRAGIEAFGRKYRKVGESRTKTMELYQPVYQTGGIGTIAEWRSHKTTVSTLLGFDRYFTLEYQVLKTLFALVTNMPNEWNIRMNITRGERIQTVAGALQSSIVAACFSLQGQIARAAINTPIQGTGAQITKRVQVALWELQPCGYCDWIVEPMNIHDEIMCPTHPNYTNQVESIVKSEVQELTKIVPLLAIDWVTGITSWADKKKKKKIEQLT